MAKGASDSIRRLREEAYARDAAERQRATMDRMLAIPEVKALVHQPMSPDAWLVEAAKEAASIARGAARSAKATGPNPISAEIAGIVARSLRSPDAAAVHPKAGAEIGRKIAKAAEPVPYHGYADKEKRKAYMREWMRKKRAVARERPLTG